jgi:predicted dehydrogenase
MKLCAVGTGFITKSMLEEFARSEHLNCTSICSRQESKGLSMGEPFGITKVYTSLEDMLADPEVEAVYIASPNSLHYPQTKAALLAGKHVLCEKPFATTAAQAAEVIALAKEKHLLLFETITLAHHPNYSKLKEFLPQLGPLKTVIANFCQYSSRFPALLAGQVSPVLDPAYCGGALMDINLYNIHFVAGLFGKPENLHYFPNVYENGVDTSGSLVLQYPGFTCLCVGAKDSAAENGVQIIGQNGYIKVTPSSSNCASLEVCIRGQEPQRFDYPENPWYYEVQSLSSLMGAQDYDACYTALDTTQIVVEILEKARKSGNLTF